MCKTNMKANLYHTNICKNDYEKNITRLWCKIVFKIGVEYIEGNEWSYFYLYPFEDLVQKNF
jgi:hypothetical protein